MKLSWIYRKKEDIVTRRIAGETLLIPVRGDLASIQRIFALNPVAEYIWQQLDGERSLEEIRDEILASFDTEKEQADEDLQEFIAQLLEVGLIEEGI